MTPLRPLPAGPWIALDERDHRPSCVLSLSQAPSSEARWRLRLYALLARGQVELGELVTQGPLGGAPRRTRAGAIGWCPGAESWAVLATLEDGVPSAVELVGLAADDGCLAGEVPFVALEGGAPPPAATGWGYLSGVGLAAVATPAGSRLHQVSAIAGVADGAIAISGGAAIVIPAGAAWSETWPGPVAPLGPVGFGATAAIASWQISWGARP